MKCKIFFCAVLFGVFALGGANSGITGDEKKVPGKLVQVDTNNLQTPMGKTWTGLVRLGDMVQLSVFCRADRKEDDLRTIKVELKGDCAVTLGEVVEVPVWIQPRTKAEEFIGPKPDHKKKHLCCFLKTVKRGDLAVKITPVGMDGKDRPTRELIIRVFTASDGPPPRDR